MISINTKHSPAQTMFLGPFRVLRYLFWFVRVCSWNRWKTSLRCGPRFQVFRNRRNANGDRIYKPFRWGFAILGLEIGDRGGSREYVRRQMFGLRRSEIEAESLHMQEAVKHWREECSMLAAKVQYLLDHHPTYDQGRAAAWMAFCKGLAVMGNRDAGDYREVFDDWWRSYGARDVSYLEPDGHFAFPDGDMWAKTGSPAAAMLYPNLFRARNKS